MCLHYLVKLIAWVLLLYITYFSIQPVDCWHQIFANCWNNSFQQSTTVSAVFTDMGNHAGDGLQQGEDCKCWRTSPAHHGWVGTSWSAHYQWHSEGVAKSTASVCCCWRRTVWIWTVTPDSTVLLQLCIMTLPFNRLTAYNIWRDYFQCSLTLSVTCSRCEAL